MSKLNQKKLIKGNLGHRRTESDYLAVLLDTVTLEDWRDVVDGALQSAKEGDPQARAWLAQFLVGKPEFKAPTPLTVVVQRLNNDDPVVEKIAKPIIDKSFFPMTLDNDETEDNIRDLIAKELAEKGHEL